MLAELERKTSRTVKAIERLLILRRLPFDPNTFTRRFIAESAIIAQTLNYHTGGQNWQEEFRKKYLNQ